VLGYTHAMADLLGAADVLVHSTGGMTCLEAAVQGCPVIAYGFARGHVRHNVQAMVRHGLIRRARSSHELTAQIGEALGCADALVSYLEDRPCASSALLEMLAPRTSFKKVLVGQFDADADGAGMTHVELGPATRRAVH
jgi:hypothetical protein